MLKGFNQANKFRLTLDMYLRSKYVMNSFMCALIQITHFEYSFCNSNWHETVFKYSM